MKKLTKKEMVAKIKEIKNVKDSSILKALMRKTHDALLAELNRCINEESKADTEKRVGIKFEEVEPLTEIKAPKRVAQYGINKVVSTTNPGGNEMEKPELKENFVIGARDVSQWKYGKKVKPAEATEAVEAVAGVKAVAAVEAIPAIKADKEAGIKAAKAVPAIAAVEAVKAVKASPAKPATNGSIQMYFKADTEEMAQEAVARMIHEGLTPDNADQDGNAVFEDKENKIFFFSFTHELDRTLRDAFKAAKAKDGYNAAGLAALKEVAKEKAKADKEAAKAKEKAEAEKSEARGNVKSGDDEEKTETAGDDDEEGSEWPE